MVRRLVSVVVAVCSVLAFGTGARSSPVDVSIHDIQYTTDPSGDSPYVGQEVTVSGVVSAISQYGYTVAEAPGAWQSVFVYSQLDGPDVGDQVKLSGTVAEYYGLTEIGDVTSYQRLSTGNAVTPTTLSAANVDQEQYESVLVTVPNVAVAGLTAYGTWVVADGSWYALVGDTSDYVYFPKAGDVLDSVTGTVGLDYNIRSVNPRGTNDIVGAPVPRPHYALKGDVVTMNDSREVLPDAYVEVLGDRIVGITTTAPAGVDVVDTGGLILPGLIDSHIHPQYGALGTIPFGETFDDRYEWRATATYDAFGDQWVAIRDFGGAYAQYANMVKLTEARALSAGTTTIRGANCNGSLGDLFGHEGIGIHNGGRFPDRTHWNTFPLWETPQYWQDKSEEYWERFLIHLSEGVNADALTEFYMLYLSGLLDERTAIIHGIPYGATEWALMAAADAHLIWSPVGNMMLYGATADIPGALAAGVNVALSTDWPQAGSLTILDEMKYAYQLSLDQWGGLLTPQMLAELVTRNAAYAIGMEDRAGQIAPGYQADFMVIPGDPGDPYQALLDADPADVQLTIVGGRPLYGETGLLDGFAFPTYSELVHVGDSVKGITLAVDSHGIAQSDKTLAEIVAELRAAYDAVDPKVSEFLPMRAFAVPEPTTMLLVLAGLGMLARRRRRP